MDNKYGFIDNSGSMVIEPKYDYVESFNGGFALVKLHNKYGYITKDGIEKLNWNMIMVNHFQKDLPR